MNSSNSSSAVCSDCKDEGDYVVAVAVVDSDAGFVDGSSIDERRNRRPRHQHPEGFGIRDCLHRRYLN